jgi:small GTP-binding protein
MPRDENQQSSSSANDNSVIRLLLLGDSAVGKSSLLLRFCEGRFENNFVITIGVDFKTKTMNIDGKNYRVQVWDTAGQERFRTITPAYYRNAMGVLILFDVTNKKSFDSTYPYLIITIYPRRGLLGSQFRRAWCSRRSESIGG